MKATLESYGFALGDLTSYDSDDDATGGIIYQITENCDPVKPATGSTSLYGDDARDEKGNKIPPMKLSGYVRLKPLFEFFPSRRGKNPIRKGKTVLVYHYSIEKGLMKKVDILSLGTKYVELGNLIRDLANKHGADV
jgi:hypothetical protein